MRLHPTPYTLYSRHGFTLAELLVTIGLAIVIGIITLPNLQGRRSPAELDAVVRKSAALLREAQSRTIAGDSNANWGVHFENSSTSPFFTLFSDVYSTSTASAQSRTALPWGIRYASSRVPLGSSQDILFLRITGRPVEATSTTFERMIGSTVMESSTISISATGAVSF